MATVYSASVHQSEISSFLRTSAPGLQLLYRSSCFSAFCCFYKLGGDRGGWLGSAIRVGIIFKQRKKS